MAVADGIPEAVISSDAESDANDSGQETDPEYAGYSLLSQEVPQQHSQPDLPDTSENPVLEDFDIDAELYRKLNGVDIYPRGHFDLVDLADGDSKQSEDEVLSPSQNETSSDQSRDIELTSEKCSQIAQAMSSIQLPSVSIPPWSQNLSDEELSRIVNKKIFHD